MQNELFPSTEGVDGVPEPYPEQVLPLPLVPVASHFSGGDTPREGMATPVQILDYPEDPLNWETTGNRPKGETDKDVLVVDSSPPQGSPVRRRRMASRGLLPLSGAAGLEGGGTAADPC